MKNLDGMLRWLLEDLACANCAVDEAALQRDPDNFDPSQDLRGIFGVDVLSSRLSPFRL